MFKLFLIIIWSVSCVIHVLIICRLSGLSPFMGDNDAETLANVTTAEWDFDDPVFEDISQEAKEFIQDLLVKAQSYVKYTLCPCLYYFEQYDFSTNFILACS